MHRRRSLPLLRIAALVALLAGGAVVVPAAATDRVVVVQPGDTMGQIALEHGINLRQLVAWNAIADPNRIYPGQRLRVSVQPAPSPSPIPPPKPQVHVVRSGEHLTGIARRYGTTIAVIVAANGIANPSFLRVGQRLTILAATSGAAPAVPPAPAAPAAPAASSRSHTVAVGEHLTGIARRYGTTIAIIVAANGIANPSYLRVGQRLTILGPAASAGQPGTAMPASMRAVVAARDDIRAMIADEAEARGVPVAFALAVAWQESGWQSGVASNAGAVGVMQLTPATADWVASTMLGGNIDLRDARSNVRAGICLVRHYLDRYHGDKALVLAAYFQGQTAADRHGVYPVSRPYVASVLALEATFAR